MNRVRVDPVIVSTLKRRDGEDGTKKDATLRSHDKFNTTIKNPRETSAESTPLASPQYQLSSKESQENVKAQGFLTISHGNRVN